MEEQASNRMDVVIPPAGSPNARAASAHASQTDADRPAVKRYDFRSPKPANRGPLRALHDLHGGFAETFAASLTAFVRKPVDVKLLGADQLLLREFLARLDNPTCLAMLPIESLPEPWIVDLQPSILYPMIDGMLGGSDAVGLASRRQPTDIELRLAGRIFALLCDELQRAWQPVADLRPRLGAIDTNPRSARAFSSNETAYMLRFGISLGQRRGLMRLCLSDRSLEPMRSRLAGESADSALPAPASAENAERIGRAVSGSRMEVKAWLAESTITTQDLIGLRVGDIITTRQDVHSPVVVTVEDVPKFHARPGALRGRKAVVISDRLEDDGPSS